MLEARVKVSAGEVETTSPLQPVNKLPNAGLAVTVYFLPSVRVPAVRLGVMPPLPLVNRVNKWAKGSGTTATVNVLVAL